MKVKDLIDKLKSFPADAPVMVQGYEDGYDAVKVVREVSVTKNSTAEDWNGEYEEASAGGKNSISAVVILGKRR